MLIREFMRMPLINANIIHQNQHLLAAFAPIRGFASFLNYTNLRTSYKPDSVFALRQCTAINLALALLPSSSELRSFLQFARKILRAYDKSLLLLQMGLATHPDHSGANQVANINQDILKTNIHVLKLFTFHQYPSLKFYYFQFDLKYNHLP